MKIGVEGNEGEYERIICTEQEKNIGRGWPEGGL